MAGKIQKQDVKTETELITAGATAADLINDTQIYVTASGINKTLDDAIVAGDLGGGANEFLSNLTAPVAINQNLTSDGTNTRDLGNSTFPWRSLYALSWRFRAAGQEHGQALYNGTTPSGAANVLGMFASLTSKAVGIWTGAATATGDAHVETGNASAGNSGNIHIRTGTATGLKGHVDMQNCRALILPKLASAPASPVAGMIYYDTTLNKSYTYDGATWQAHW